MANGFNLFSFDSLGGNQLNKAISNQKLPTVAPYNPGAQPTYSPSPKNMLQSEAKISIPDNAPQSGLYNKLYNVGTGIADWTAGVTTERAKEERQGGMTENQMRAVVREMRKDKLSDEEIALQLEAIDNQLMLEYKQSQKTAYEQASLPRKLAGGAVNLAAGNLQTIAQYGGNILDVATAGKTGIGEDVSQMMEQNKQLFGDSAAFKAGTYLPDVAIAVSPIGGGFISGGKSALGIAGRSGVVGAGFGASQPVLEQGSEVDIGDIITGGVVGGVAGTVAGPVLSVAGKGIMKTAEKTGKYGKALVKGGFEGLGKSVSRDVSSIKAPGYETFTRNIPKAVVRRDLGFTPTERAKIEKITGTDEAQYILSKGLAGKGKEELAEVFMKQSDDMYNGITRELSKVQGRVQSPVAKEALMDILEQLESSPKIARAYAKDIEGVKAMLAREDFSLSELNNIRRAYDKVNTGMFTVQGKARSGLENAIDVKVRQDLSNQLQKEAKKYGVDVKAMNTELRAGIEMKDALLRRLSQEERNNFIGLQDLGVSAILSGGEPVSAVATIVAKKYAEKVAPGLSQKLYNINKTPNVTRNVSRGNTITPRNKSSQLGLASNHSSPVVSNVVKPKKIKNETQPKVNTPEIPEGYIKNPLTGEIIKKPRGMNAGFIKVGLPEKTVKSADVYIKPVNKLNTGEEITLVRGTGGKGSGAGEAIRGKGMYLTDNIDVAKHYGPDIKTVTLRNSDILDGSEILKNSKQIIQSLPKEMRVYLDDNFEYSYNSLIKTIEGNTGIDAEKIAESLNSAIKGKYKGVKFEIGLVNDSLSERGLGNKNAFLIFSNEKPIKVPEKNIVKPDPLIEEARKYKGAEEFVKAQGKLLYRGGVSEGTSFTTQKRIAEDFAKYRGGSVKEYIISKNAKIADYNDFPDRLYKNTDNFEMWLDKKEDKLSFMENELEREFEKATKWAKNNGYDAINLPVEDEIRIINKGVAREKQEIMKIYEQAKKQK